jgi:hypothetical protein
VDCRPHLIFGHFQNQTIFGLDKATREIFPSLLPMFMILGWFATERNFAFSPALDSSITQPKIEPSDTTAGTPNFGLSYQFFGLSNFGFS